MNEFVSPFDLFPEKEFSSYESYVNYVSTLPKPVRSLLVGSTTAEFIEDILRPQFNLSDSQVTVATAIIRDVLLANLFIGEMLGALTDEAGLDPQNAKKMSDMIVGQLFAPAIEDIKKLQRENFADRLGGGAAPQPPRPVSAQPQSSQTINLRQSTVSTSPQPVQPQPKPIAPPAIPTSRPAPIQPQPSRPPVQQPAQPQQQSQAQPNPKPQNVFKIPDLGPSPQQNQQQNAPQKNVLDLRNQ